MRILLVSPDLMSTSRIAGLAASMGASLEMLASPDAAAPDGPFDAVLVDLQAIAGDAAAIVSRVRAAIEPRPSQEGVPLRVVAFGPHVQKQRLEDALAGGADEAVSRGELLGGFAALLGRVTR